MGAISAKPDAARYEMARKAVSAGSVALGRIIHH